MKRWIKITLWILGSTTTLVVLVTVVALLLLTPKRLTPLVNEYANGYLDATVHFDTVDLSWWDEFPMVTLKLKNGSIISDVFDNRSDTLLSFSELRLSTDLLAILNGAFTTRRISIKHPCASLYVDSTGKANYDIYSSTDTTESAPSDFMVNVDRISISAGARIRYENLHDSIDADLNFERFAMSGKLTNDIEKLELSQLRARDLSYRLRMGELSVNQNFDSIRVKQKQGLAYRLDLSSQASLSLDSSKIYNLNVNGDVRLDSLFSSNMGFGVDSLIVNMNNIKMALTGDVALLGDSIRSDMRLSLHPLDFQYVKDFLPPNMPFDADLKADIDLHVDGIFNDKSKVFPRVELDLGVVDGSLSLREQGISLSDLLLKAHLNFDMQNPSQTGFSIDTISLKSPGLEFNGTASLWDAMRDGELKAKVDGMVDLQQFEILRRMQVSDIAYGRIDFNGACNYKLSDFTPQKIGRCDIHFRVVSDDFRVRMPDLEIEMLAQRMSASVGSNASSRDTTLIAKGTRILRASLRADSVMFRMGNQIYANLGGARISARSAASKYTGDTTTAHPFVGNIDARIVQVVGEDSSSIRVREPKIQFTVLPYEHNRRVPELSAHLSSRHIAMRSKSGRWSISRPQFDAKARIATADPRFEKTRQRRLDSLQRIYPQVDRDSLVVFAAMVNSLTRVKDDFVAGDIDMKLDNQFGQLLRKWNVEGTLKASRSRIVTPYLPLESRVENIDVKFTHNAIELNKTLFRLGESSMVVTGQVTNLRRALLGRGTLAVNIDVDADTINVNQLIIAGNQGMAMMATDSLVSVAENQSDEQLQETIQTAASENIANSLLIIPSNIKADIKLNAKYGKYAVMEFRELKSELQMKDRCMQITYIVARTNSGDMTLSGIYATKSRDQITFGIDLDMQNMQVDKLIKLVPQIDTLYPMLRSFEGLIDCKMAATAALDTVMNVKLETLNAACSINGRDMVLLDGETFTEISKMMKFKNRNRNKIDNISVEMLIRDSRVETFPFILQMDRYKTAVSGIHNLDLSFDYHISVLKSPLPFRLGLDIFGTLDDWDFKIGRARYKNEKVPSYVDLIENTRMGLSRKIYDIFHRGIGTATLEGMNVLEAVADTTVKIERIEELNATDSVILIESGIIETQPQ